MTALTDDSFAPGFLISSPRLEGSPFERAVVLMVQHGEEGAMGYIVNKPLQLTFGGLMASVDGALEERMAGSTRERAVLYGGPVRTSQLWLIHQDRGAERSDDQAVEAARAADGDIVFADGWVVSASAMAIERVGASASTPPVYPVLGYAGWGPGQLEAEIGEGSWLWCAMDEELLTEAEPEQMWDRALARTGVHPAAFLMMARGDAV